MPSLRELQAIAYDAFIGESPEQLAPYIERGHVERMPRIRVYRNNLHQNLVNTLQVTYPVIERLVGEDCFHSLAVAYGRQHPSGHGDLARLGEHFGDALDRRYANSRFPWLGDVARLEWAIESVRGVPDRHPLDLRLLQSSAGEDFPNLRLTLRPDVRLLRSRWPVLDIWEAHQPDYQGDYAWNDDTHQILIRRMNADVEMRHLSLQTWTFLDAIERDHRLLDAMAMAQMVPAPDTANPLLEVAAWGLFSDVKPLI